MLYPAHVQKPGVIFHIHEHWRGPGMHYGRGCGDKGHGSGDHLISGTDIEGQQSQMQGGGTGV